MTQNPHPPAGWYPQGDQERWWDGNAWSDNFRPLGSDTSGGYPPMFQAQPQQGYGQGYGQAYGQQPGQQPGYPAYGAQQPYYGAPVKKSNTARNLLIGFGVLFVLLVGGCIAGVAIVADQVDEVVNDDTPGGPNNPLTITEGEEFEVAGFKYSAGWTIVADTVGDADIENLKVENDRDSAEYAFVTVKLLQANEVVASISCSNPGADQIGSGTIVTLDCSSIDTLPTAWDEVTIQDAF